MKYGVIGAKLGHSFSPEIHKLIGDYEYRIVELDTDGLDGLLKSKDFCAVNITIPYKETVIPYLDEVDDSVKRIGAVNVIVNRDGRLCGYNTDYNGAYALIKKAGVEILGKNVLILGTGGTSKTMTAVAEDMGAARITHVSRRSGGGAVDYATAMSDYTDTQVIINTTPSGMYPDSEGCPIDISCFPALEGVVDAVYHPLASRLVRNARAKGIKAKGGLYMLVVQAVYASALFFDTTPELEIIDRVYGEIRCRRQNIVLIGMPSSGKSTVGEIIAKKTGKPFFDVDEEIVKRTGKTISEIFENDGEPYFRALESEVIAELSIKQGIVIATGGGSVLDNENVQKLRANGMLIYLDRPLEKLISTSDRPLAASRDKLNRLYTERKDIYAAAADRTVYAGIGSRRVAEAVMEEFAK